MRSFKRRVWRGGQLVTVSSIQALTRLGLVDAWGLREHSHTAAFGGRDDGAPIRAGFQLITNIFILKFDLSIKT
jgi:hypothetical protein